jgi:hypothetical protein
MFVEPSVSRAKLDRELSNFLQHAKVYRRRGIWLLEYDFPTVLFALAAINLKPYMVVPCGVLLDFSNYDVDPPSVRFVNPATMVPLKANEIPYKFVRQGLNGEPTALVQEWTPDDDRPFLCLQGVREYHDNSGHSGDPWLLHRGSGAGTLMYLLNSLAKYGVEPISQIHVQLVLGINGVPT